MHADQHGRHHDEQPEMLSYEGRPLPRPVEELVGQGRVTLDSDNVFGENSGAI